MDLKKLLEQLRALSAELEAALAEEDAATDEAGKSAARSKYEAKSKEFETLELKVHKAKAHAKRVGVIGEVEGLAAPAGNVIPLQGKSPANAKDHDAEEAVLVSHFTDWMCGKSISDQAMDALQPKAPGWKAAKEKSGLALPKSIARTLLPEAHCFGKALPLTSGQTSPANLFQSDFRKELAMYTGEAPAIFPNTFKIPTVAGEVKWPQLDQAAPGAEGGADEFAEYGYVACAWTGEGGEKPGTEPKFIQKDIKAHELSASTDISRTLLNRSSIDIRAMLPGLFRASLLHKIDLALINGDGVGKPLGVLQTAGIGAPARTTGSQVKYEDLVNLEFAVAPQFRANGRYVVGDTALKNLRLKKDLQDRPLFLPLNSPISEGASQKGLNGYPFVPTQRTTLGAAGDLIFGDWSHYVCPVEQEIVLAASEHAEFRKGVIVFIAYVLVGGRVMQPRAFAKLPA